MLKRVLYRSLEFQVKLAVVFSVDFPLLSLPKCGTVPHFCSGNLKMWDSPTKSGTVGRSGYFDKSDFPFHACNFMAS